MKINHRTSDDFRMESNPSHRLFLATCIKTLKQCQMAVKKGTWIKDDMDAKINRIVKVYDEVL